LGLLWPCPQILRPDWKGFPRANPLTYCASSPVMKEIFFITLASGVNLIKLFWSNFTLIFFKLDCLTTRRFFLAALKRYSLQKRVNKFTTQKFYEIDPWSPYYKTLRSHNKYNCIYSVVSQCFFYYHPLQLASLNTLAYYGMGNLQCVVILLLNLF